MDLPSGFKYTSIRFQSRFTSRFHGSVALDPSPDPALKLNDSDSPSERTKKLLLLAQAKDLLPTLSDTAEQRIEKLLQMEKHIRKIVARERRSAGVIGKAGSKPLPERWNSTTCTMFRENLGEAASMSFGRRQEGSGRFQRSAAG